MMPTVLDYCLFLGRSTSTTQPPHDADKEKKHAFAEQAKNH